VLPSLAALAGPTGDLVLLVKPQFELDPADVGDGVVRDPQLHERAVALVASACRALGLDVRGPVVSPLPGRDGNTELFLAARSGAVDMRR
jgi:23S rRNA (cytidine1920-2'-O)/16S rRNA (cytidine1409-2'-O)-methyltransferase